jgi:uncharacterized circularly permuted ATP-grasp superfamily protein
MVRTVSGLKPVSVLWRRLDASFADPLELRWRHRGSARRDWSRRCGRVTISFVNALGSGILETRAARLPAAVSAAG